ncbi:hypothetical protein [Roseibium sediminis]|uniref:hypothetical protein n=1 Tax=Roseibium sediminis TaxID=1775174 RepID=UPI00123CB655|nr:hypothetical protein [Roseibium sediminis]
MAGLGKSIKGNSAAFDAVRKGGKEFKEAGTGKVTHFNNGEKPPLKEDLTAANKGNPYPKGDPSPLSNKEWDDARPKGTPTSENPNFVKAEKLGDGYKVHMRHESGDVYSVPYDKNGNPDFHNVRNESKGGTPVENVIYPGSDKVQIELTELNPKDLNTDGSFKYRQYDLNDPEQLKAAQDRARQMDKRKANKALGENLDGDEWHWHHAGGKSMIAVDASVHKLFKHHGEFASNKAAQLGE